MPIEPPFLLNDATAIADHCKRLHAGSAEGSVLDTGPQPDAQLHVIYRTQFRFHRFWQTRSITPCWSGEIEKADLSKAVEAGASESLPAEDRFVQVDWDDRTNVRVGGLALAMIRGDSRARGKKVWVPISKRLPKAVQIQEEGWKWEPPRVQPGSPTAQWGIRGDATLRLKPFCPGGDVRTYKMVTVWQRWEYGSMKGKKKYSFDMCTLPPGTYAGYVQAMPKHWSDEAERKRYPAIVIAWEWTPPAEAPVEPEEPSDDGKSKKKKRGPHKSKDLHWTMGVRGWKLKNPKSQKRTTGIYVHPGNKPAWFLGCMAPGPVDRHREWGFETRGDTEKAMWEVLELVGVSRDEYVAHYNPPKTKKRHKWFVICVEAANDDVIASDGWSRQRIWLD